MWKKELERGTKLEFNFAFERERMEEEKNYQTILKWVIMLI